MTKYRWWESISPHQLRKLWEPTELEYNEIIPGKLCVGSAPPIGPMLFHAGFDSVYLCAEEWQPKRFPGVEINHYPIKDYEVSIEAVQTSVDCAKAIVNDLRKGKRVLVSCLAGHDRSAAVAALVLHLLKGWPGTKCIEYVKRKRPGALGSVQTLWLSKIGTNK